MFSFAPCAFARAPDPMAILSLPEVREEPVISVPIIMLSVEVELSRVKVPLSIISISAIACGEIKQKRNKINNFLEFFI